MTKNFVLAEYSVFSDLFSIIKKTIISGNIQEKKYKIFEMVNFHFAGYFGDFLYEHAKTDFSTTFFILVDTQPRSKLFKKKKTQIISEYSKSQLSYA